MGQPDIARVGQLRSDMDDAYLILGDINETVKDHTKRLDRLEQGQRRTNERLDRLEDGQRQMTATLAEHTAVLTEMLTLLRAR